MELALNTQISKANTRQKSYFVPVILLTLLFLLSAYGKYSSALSIVVSIVEVFICIAALFDRTLVRFYLYYFLFTGISLSSPVFVYNDSTATLYTFNNLPLVQGYHTTIILLIAFVLVLLKTKGSFLSIFGENREARKTFLTFLYFLIVGISFGIITFLVNDNGMGNHFDLWFYLFRRSLLVYINLFLLISGCFYCFLTCKELRAKFNYYLLVFLFAVSSATILSVLLGWSADYGSGTTLLLSQAAIYSVFLLVYPFYSKSKLSINVTSIILGILSCFCMLFKASELAGKWWIYIFIAGVLIVFKSIISQKRSLRVFGVIILTGAILGFIFLLNNNIGFGLSETKMKQFSEALDIINPDWYSNLSNSPKSRIDEIVNIFLEYINKPIYSLFGKGFSASFIKRWGTSDWSINSSGTYSDLELQYQVFSNMHESVNSLLLTFGLFGFVFLLKEFIFFIKNINKSIVHVLGFVWFIFFITAPYSALYIGLCCYVYSKSYSINENS